MFKEVWGIAKLKKTWFDLFKAVKGKDVESRLYLVKITNTKISVTDGRQLLVLSRDVDWDIEPGFYVLAPQDRLLVKASDAENIEYPDLKSFEDFTDRDKTATIQLGLGMPLTTMVHAVTEFGCYVNLDLYSKALTAIDSLDPAFARIYGYKDHEVSKKANLVIQFSAECIDCLYVMMPAEKTEKLLKVDEMPLFSKKQAG